MSDEAIDVQKIILHELQEIRGEVRLIPKLQAQLDSMRDTTQQLDMAMRESTAALQTQALAHSKIIDELRLQVHQSTAAMMGISNDVQSAMARIKDLERQTSAAFQQQLRLAKDVRAAQCYPEPGEYKTLKTEVDTLPVLRKDMQEICKDISGFKKHIPWLQGIEWFLRILFYAMASAAAAGLLLLLGQSLLKAFS